MSAVAPLHQNDPAFPCGELHDDPGLTAREYIAAACMASLVRTTNTFADAAVIAADALLLALGGEPALSRKQTRKTRS